MAEAVSRRAAAATASLALLLLAACAGRPPVHVEPNPLADFAAYRTYGWLAAPPEPQADRRETAVELFGWQLRNAVDAGMRARGYALDAEQPDLLLAVRVGIAERYTDTLGEYWRYADMGGTQSLFSAFSLGYEEATLVVEAFDANSRQLVWRGRTAVSMDARQRGERAAAAIAELMKSFPGGVR